MIFSIIIPTFNRCDLLKECLTRVFEQDFPPTEYEVIVTVDGSTDRTLDMLRALSPVCHLKVIEQGNKGPAVARNAGVAAATGRLLLFLDDDILCDPQLLNEHLAAHSDSSPAVVHGPIYVAPESPRTIVADSTRAWYESYFSQFSAGRPLDVLQDRFLIGNASMPRTAFLQSGGFDPDMFALEDFELGIRLWKSAISFVYQPNALVYEHFSKSTYGFLKRDAFSYGRAEILVCQKHGEFRRHSALSTLGEGTSSKRLMRQLAVCAVLHAHLLLAPFLWALELLIGFAWARRLGVRVLALGHRLRVLEGARRQAGSFRALRRSFGARLPVLLYHNVGAIPSARVSESTRLSELVLSPGQFERHLHWLSFRGYNTISPFDWFQWVTNGVQLPAKPILLTFDDAYADLVVHAFPALQRFGFRASVFVVTAQIGGQNVWDCGDTENASALMTAAEIRTWSMQNIDFGAHTRNHRDLAKVPFSEATEEILGSAHDLREVVGETTLAFAYPFGSFSADVKHLVQESYKVGFSVDEGLNFLRTDLSALRRLYIPDHTWFLDFVFRIQLGWSPIIGLRSRLRIRSRFQNLWRKMVGFLGGSERG